MTYRETADYTKYTLDALLTLQERIERTGDTNGNLAQVYAELCRRLPKEGWDSLAKEK